MYRVGASLVIGSLDQVPDGFWVATERVTRLAAGEPEEALGAAVLAALCASRTGVPAPERSSRNESAAVTAAGYRSYRAFVRDAVLVMVERAGDTVLLTPTRNGGPTGEGRGFRAEPVSAVSAPASPAAVGRAAAVALHRAVPFTR